MLLLALLACGGDLSNRVFDEDADFIAALPSSDQLALSYPQPEAVADDPADLYVLNVEAIASAQGLLGGVTAATDEVVLLPPTERGEDYRVWGPTPFDGDPDLFLRVEMSRSSTGATYSYAFQLAETSAGPWWEYLVGTHVAGASEVALGSGTIDLAEGSWGGGAVLDYDLRERREIGVTAEQGGTVLVQWRWIEGEDGGASLDYAQPSDSVSGLLGKQDEELTSSSAWLGDGAGRGVARLTGGDLGKSTLELVQCWDETGATTWSWDSEGWTEELGSEADCPLGSGL